MTASFDFLGALALLWLAPAPQSAAPHAQPPQAVRPGHLAPDDFTADPIVAEDEAVLVKLVSAEGEPELLDVVAHGAPAHEVLGRIAKEVGRELKLDPGEAVQFATRGVDVNLKRRPLREVVTWIGGAAGLVVDVGRRDLRCAADLLDAPSPEERLQRAIDGWRSALLHDPTQPDAPRLRFEIGNALYQLGEFMQATSAYHDLERDAPEFGDMPFVHFRCGFAHAQLGDEEGAQSQWFRIADRYPHHSLVAAARLAAVRSLRRQKDETNANTVLRLVVESMREGLAPEDLIEAGELLDEGGNHKGAIEALQRALAATSDPVLEERGAVALTRAQAGRADWTGVIETAERYVKGHPEGARGAEVAWLLATAHRELADPFTALLALRRARDLRPDDRIEARCDLLEGTIYAESGVEARAEPCLSRAGASVFPEIAAPALALHAKLLIDSGQFETARRVYERLATLTGHEIEAAVGRAEVSLLQRNRKLCLAVVDETLPLANEAQRARLLEIAGEALRGAGDADLLDLFAPAALAPPGAEQNPDPNPEPSDDR